MIEKRKKIKLKLKHHKWTQLHQYQTQTKDTLNKRKIQVLKEILIYNNNNKIPHYSARRKQAEDWEFGEQRQSQHQNLIGKQKQGNFRAETKKT